MILCFVFVDVKDEQNDAQVQEDNASGLSNGRITVTDNIDGASIHAVFAEDEKDEGEDGSDDKDKGEDGSDSDGYLSEVLDLIMLELH
ncbi:Hypothetical predicted protein [Olea europaea subsp. europaea]|uniref:Uncharacterized protein n=1 Tax=Olea europaea subsp. europaea TaxID=158383 RepID=A0A8S0RF99_OLEEU|nr:Hypothetical predicted protein [Olea europaea subsp. europaea]